MIIHFVWYCEPMVVCYCNWIRMRLFERRVTIKSDFHLEVALFVCVQGRFFITPYMLFLIQYSCQKKSASLYFILWISSKLHLFTPQFTALLFWNQRKSWSKNPFKTVITGAILSYSRLITFISICFSKKNVINANYYKVVHVVMSKY